MRRLPAVVFAVAVAAVTASSVAIASYTSTYMGLTIPEVGDPGPTYASNVSDALDLIDAHDHSSGKGTYITPAGININADLPMNIEDLTEVRTIRFTGVPTVPEGGELLSLYTNGEDLFYVDISGDDIQITANGDVAAPNGVISGMTGSASVVYSSLADSYAFTDDGGRPAGGDFGCIRVAEEVVGGKGPVICSNAATAADFAFTFMAALPASNRLTCLDASGNLSTCTSVATAQSLVVTSSVNAASVTASGALVAGTTVTASGGVGVASTTGGSTKACDGTGTSSTSPTDIGGCGFTGLTASQAYFISCRFAVDSAAATTGVQIGLDFSPAASSAQYDCGSWSSTSVWTYAATTGDDSRCVMTSTVAGANSAYTLSGWFENAASTTSVTPRLRSEVGASAVTVYAGSCTVTPANP